MFGHFLSWWHKWHNMSREITTTHAIRAARFDEIRDSMTKVQVALHSLQSSIDSITDSIDLKRK